MRIANRSLAVALTLLWSGSVPALGQGAKIGFVDSQALGERQQSADCALHVAFPGRAMTGHGLFDGSRGVLGKRQLRVRSRSHRNAACFTQAKRTLHVSREKVPLQAGTIRGMIYGDPTQAIVDEREALGEISASGTDRPGRHVAQDVAVAVDHAPPCDHGPGVDAQHAHHYLHTTTVLHIRAKAEPCKNVSYHSEIWR